MSGLEIIGPHQSSFIMLDPHDALWIVIPSFSVLLEDHAIFQIRLRDVDRRGRLLLESQHPVECHVLNRQKCSVAYDNHVVLAIADQYAVGGLYYLRKYLLDRICGQISFPLWSSFPVRTSNKDWSFITVNNVLKLHLNNHLLCRATCPINIERGMQRFFHVRSVEVNSRILRGVDEPGRESENVPEIFCQPTKTCRAACFLYLPEQWAHFGYLVYIKAWILQQGSVVYRIEDVAVIIGRIVEIVWWLVSRGWKLQVLVNNFSIATSLMSLLNIVQERLIQVEEIAVLHRKRCCYHLGLRICKIANHRVVDKGPTQIVILGIICI